VTPGRRDEKVLKRCLTTDLRVASVQTYYTAPLLGSISAHGLQSEIAHEASESRSRGPLPPPWPSEANPPKRRFTVKTTNPAFPILAAAEREYDKEVPVV